MAGMVCAAARLAAEDCFPGPRSKGKSEFIARCAQALKQRVPHAETVLTKLSKEDQASIRKSLAGQEEKEPYEGCLMEECLDKEIKWVTEENISRCAHCQMPKCYGRTVFGLNDILAPHLKRALALLRGATHVPARVGPVVRAVEAVVEHLHGARAMRT